MNIVCCARYIKILIVCREHLHYIVDKDNLLAQCTKIKPGVCHKG